MFWREKRSELHAEQCCFLELEASFLSNESVFIFCKPVPSLIPSAGGQRKVEKHEPNAYARVSSTKSVYNLECYQQVSTTIGYGRYRHLIFKKVKSESKIELYIFVLLRLYLVWFSNLLYFMYKDRNLILRRYMSE